MAAEASAPAETLIVEDDWSAGILIIAIMRKLGWPLCFLLGAEGEVHRFMRGHRSQSSCVPAHSQQAKRSPRPLDHGSLVYLYRRAAE